MLEGTHDFTAFRSQHCDAENPLRTIHSFEAILAPPVLFLDVRANAFLRNQVRIMAGTLLEIGLGRQRGDAIPSILQSRDRRQASPTLPPRGLILMRVRYPGEAPIVSSPSFLCTPGG
jgi:tRNA pseudouridine38-40 synthase